MFDVSFSELLLVGVIALIVIGPERLPKVARTVGHLLGRAQRYVNDVKTDIRREMDAEEFSKLKDEMEEARNTIRASVDSTKDALKNPMEEARDAMKDAAHSFNETARAATSLQDTISPQIELQAFDPPAAGKPLVNNDSAATAAGNQPSKVPAPAAPAAATSTSSPNETST